LGLGVKEHVLLVTMHHVISDAWSISNLVREISLLYHGFNTGQPLRLPELSIQYADFSVWQRRWLTGERLVNQLGYWKQQLDGLKPLDLPTDRSRTTVMSQNGATE